MGDKTGDLSCDFVLVGVLTLCFFLAGEWAPQVIDFVAAARTASPFLAVAAALDDGAAVTSLFCFCSTAAAVLARISAAKRRLSACDDVPAFDLREETAARYSEGALNDLAADDTCLLCVESGKTKS